MKKKMRATTTLVAALALAGVSALVATPSANAAASFSTPTIGSFSKKITLSKKLAKKKPSKQSHFTVTFAGTAPSSSVKYYPWDASYYGPKVKLIKTNAPKKSRSLPSVVAPATVQPGTNKGFAIKVYSTTTPGKYKVTVPVTQIVYAGVQKTTKTLTVTKKFKVKASGKLSKTRTSYYASRWKVGHTAKVHVSAPAYMKGAKAKLFYKKNGQKKFTKIGKAKLKKTKKYTTLVLGTIKTKKMTHSGKVYLKVGKTKFAHKYKMKAVKITVTRY